MTFVMGAVGTSNDAQAETAVAPPFRAHRSPRHSRPEFDGSQSSPAGRTVGYIFQRSCKTQAERDHLVPFSGPSGRAQLCSARRGNFSAAAVSAATRQLIAAGMLERVSRRCDRRIYYRLASGTWDPPLEAKLRALGRLRQVAERGIESAGGRADYRLIEMRDAFAWFEDQMEQYVKQPRSWPEKRSPG